jgi:hypothetical protein
VPYNPILSAKKKIGYSIQFNIFFDQTAERRLAKTRLIVTRVLLRGEQWQEAVEMILALDLVLNNYLFEINQMRRPRG